MKQYTYKYISDKINTAQSGTIPRVPPCETVTIKFIREDQSEYVNQDKVYSYIIL